MIRKYMLTLWMKTGDAFEEYVVFHHKFVTWMEINGYDPAKRYTQEENRRNW